MKRDSSNTSGATGEVQFSWSTGPSAGDERGWRRKGREPCLPHTAPAPKQPPGLLTATHTSRACKGQLQTSILLLLKPWVWVSLAHGTSQSKTKTPSPQPGVFTPPMHPGMQVWKQPLPEFSTEPSPFPFGGGQCWHLSGFRVSTGLFETSGAPLRYSKGDVCPLPNRMMRDVQKDNAHPRPALVVPHLFWLRTEKRTQDITPCKPCKPFSQICEGNSRTNKNSHRPFPVIVENMN